MASTAPTKPVPITSDSSDLLQRWTLRALNISQRFEGNDPWANITGNFDGCGLTCGALGWTLKWQNQQPLVKEFREKFGPALCRKLMPDSWDFYWKIISNPDENEAIKEVDVFSNGTANVKEPLKAELRTFWKHPGMIEIQTAHAAKEMGAFAMKQTNLCASYFKTDLLFHYFAYWFDQAVLNGTGGTPALQEAEAFKGRDVINWMKSLNTGYLLSDLKKNVDEWRMTPMSPIGTPLLILAMIRAKKSKTEFIPVTMCRRGTLAIGTGYVNDELFDLRKELGDNG